MLVKLGDGYHCAALNPSTALDYMLRDMSEVEPWLAGYGTRGI